MGWYLVAYNQISIPVNLDILWCISDDTPTLFESIKTILIFANWGNMWFFLQFFKITTISIIVIFWLFHWTVAWKLHLLLFSEASYKGLPKDILLREKELFCKCWKFTTPFQGLFQWEINCWASVGLCCPSVAQGKSWDWLTRLKIIQRIVWESSKTFCAMIIKRDAFDKL